MDKSKAQDSQDSSQRSRGRPRTRNPNPIRKSFMPSKASSSTSGGTGSGSSDYNDDLLSLAPSSVSLPQEYSPSSEYIIQRPHRPQDRSSPSPYDLTSRRPYSEFLNRHRKTIILGGGSSYDDVESVLMKQRKKRSSKVAEIEFGKNRVSLAPPSTQDLARHQDSTSWERWWLHSPLWRRRKFSHLIIIAVIGIAQFISALTFFSSKVIHVVHDPRECGTRKCRELFNWMNRSSGDWGRVSPCEDFYKFTCHNHKLWDTGDLVTSWTSNYARLETDGENGESLVVGMLVHDKSKKVPGTLPDKVVRYYQTCMKMWYCAPCTPFQNSTYLNLPLAMRIFLTYVFEPLLLKDPTQVPRDPWALYNSSARLINLFGYAGFFKDLGPYKHGLIMLGRTLFTTHITPEFVEHLLPLIWDVILPQAWLQDEYVLHKMATHLWKFGDTFAAIMNNQRPTCTTPESEVYHREVYFDLETPYILAYFGDRDPSNIDNSSSPEEKLKLFKYPSGEEDYLVEFHRADDSRANFLIFQSCWNHFMAQQFAGNDSKYFTPTMMTFLGLHVLIEVMQESDANTTKLYKFSDPDNLFNEIFRRDYLPRTQESRCFQSLLDSMGHYPVISYFQRFYDVKEERTRQFGLVKAAADGILQEFRPPEEGGIIFVSQLIRENVYGVLQDYDQVVGKVNVMIPMAEEDALKDEVRLPEVGDNHVENVMTWRKHLFNRTLNYWHLSRHSKFGKYAWHKSFYSVDRSFAYHSEITGGHLKFPASIFVFPYWRNDLIVADYAGAFALAVKTWISLLQIHYLPTGLQQIRRYRQNYSLSYFHGSEVDILYGDKSCRALTYGWPYPTPETEELELGTIKVRQTIMENPQLLAFRTGYRKYRDEEAHIFNLETEQGAALFPHWIAMKIALRKFQEFRNDPPNPKQFFTELNIEQRRSLSFTKLYGKYNVFNEIQLFFLLHNRQVCRSKDIKSHDYWRHVIHNTASVIHSQGFRDAFNCPVRSPFAQMPLCLPE